MSAVPWASPSGMSPAGLLLKSSSSCAVVIFSSCSILYAMSRTPIPLGIREDAVGCLFRDHVDRAHDEETGNSRKYRRVDDAQSARSVNLKVRIDDAAMLARPDRAGAARMVAPGVFGHVV